MKSRILVTLFGSPLVLAGCPENFPHAYNGGQHCCFTRFEKAPSSAPPWLESCDGSFIDAVSVCCDFDYFIECPTTTCVNNPTGAAKRLLDGETDPEEIQCGGCPAGQECKFDANSGETLNGEKLGTWDCEITLVTRNGLIGGFSALAALLLLGLLICCCCKKRKTKETFKPTYVKPHTQAPRPELVARSPSPQKQVEIIQPAVVQPAVIQPAVIQKVVPVHQPRRDDPVYLVPDTGDRSLPLRVYDNDAYSQREEPTLGDVSAVTFHPINPSEFERYSSSDCV